MDRRRKLKWYRVFNSIAVLGTFLLLRAIMGSAQGAEKLQPLFYDLRADEMSDEGVPVIKPWKTITLDPQYNGMWVVAGELDGDGLPEIVSARNVNKSDIHYTCSASAHRLDGSVLWKWGDPSIGRTRLHHDVACQIYDCDSDGKNEVIVAAQEKLVELDGATGKEKFSFAIPPDSSDCVTFCNISGNPRATDILVKTRYSQIWAYNQKGKLLWTIKMPGGYKTAHQPRPIDIDGDGKDEIMAGYALLNSDGTIRWVLEKDDGGRFGGHLDCARVFRMGKTPAETRLIYVFCGGNRIAKIDGLGNIVWSITGYHFESADIAKVCPNIVGRQIVVDIAHGRQGYNPICVLDENGSVLGQIITKGSSRFHLLIDWFGKGFESIVAAGDRAIYDGSTGKKLAIFDIQRSGICLKADMTNDGVLDLIFCDGKTVNIFKNEKGNKQPAPLPSGSDNFTLY